MYGHLLHMAMDSIRSSQQPEWIGARIYRELGKQRGPLLEDLALAPYSEDLLELNSQLHHVLVARGKEPRQAIEPLLETLKVVPGWSLELALASLAVRGPYASHSDQRVISLALAELAGFEGLKDLQHRYVRAAVQSLEHELGEMKWARDCHMDLAFSCSFPDLSQGALSDGEELTTTFATRERAAVQDPRILDVAQAAERRASALKRRPREGNAHPHVRAVSSAHPGRGPLVDWNRHFERAHLVFRAQCCVTPAQRSPGDACAVAPCPGHGIRRRGTARSVVTVP